MKKKRSVGRPKKKYPLSEQVAFMVRPTQKDRYIAASDAAEMELSDWLRMVCDRAADEALGSAES